MARKTLPALQLTRIDMTKSQTMKALEMIDAGRGVAEVARELEISTAAIYAAKRRREGKEICPCCQQVVRDGFVLDLSIIKDGVLI